MSSLEKWLALIHVDQLGPVTSNKLLDHFGSPDAVVNASRSELQFFSITNQVIDGILTPNKSAIAQDLQWLQHNSHHLITFQDTAYPDLLKQIADPPLALYCIGNPEHLKTLLSDPKLAIVGSRNASTYGKQIATTFAEKLALSGLIITSGLASGIDGAAHRGALQASIGTTIAVAACGLDRVYPAEHKKLAEEIALRGAIISEFPIGTMPKPGHFPRRNRIISGLSLGVLVIEAALKSGSLITARLASEQGREVFAVPGSIHSPNSKGCHNLIRSGAKLVESVEDIFEELKQYINFDQVETPATNTTNTDIDQIQDPEHEKILNCMGYEPMSIDDLINQTDLKVEVVSSILLILELNGQVTHNGNGVYLRTY